MCLDGLGGYIGLLGKKGLVAEIDTEVSSRFEIGEIASRVAAKGGPALLFTNVRGADFPLLVNAFGSEKLLCAAFGLRCLDDFERLGKKIFSDSVFSAGSPLSAAFGAVRMPSYFPLIMPEPAGLIAEKTNLDRLPALTLYPLDGGRFLTMAVTVIADPETGVQNAGLYRLQILPDGKLGLHFHPHKDAAHILEKYRRLGKKMPVAVVAGCDPIALYAASAPLPPFMDEMRFAGLLKGSPMRLRRCRTSSLLVPSDSEFVFEGVCDPEKLCTEGPFGDHTGYYSKAAEFPFFTPMLTVRKKYPVFTATVTGKPIKEDYYLGLATERIFLPMLRLLCPEIADLHFFPEGVFHGCAVVSIHNSFAGAAGKVFHFFWGNGQLMNSKCIIAVDAGVDVKNRTEVMWRLWNNADFSRDIVRDTGTLDELDGTGVNDGCRHGKLGAKIGIDATNKRNGSVGAARVPDEIIKLVTDRWNEYGIM